MKCEVSADLPFVYREECADGSWDGGVRAWGCQLFWAIWGMATGSANFTIGNMPSGLGAQTRRRDAAF